MAFSWQQVAKDIMRFVLVRHGETEYNRKGIIMGWKQVPLTTRGQEQARKLGERLARQYTIRHVFSSDLVRAQQTTSVIKTYLSDDILVTYMEGLRERKWGDFEGRPSRDLLRLGKRIDEIDPPNGETGIQFYQRCVNAFKTIEHFATWEEDDDILIVSHGGTTRQILGGLFNTDASKQREFPARIDNCSITSVLRRVPLWTGNDQRNMHEYVLETLNDTCHLNERP